MFVIAFNVDVYTESKFQLLSCIRYGLWYCSASATLLISMDRFIAIRFCLRYAQIMSRKTLYLMVTVGWLLSISFGMLPCIIDACIEDIYLQGNSLTGRVIYAVVINSWFIILISISTYIIIVRRNHAKRIEIGNVRFGVGQERIDIIKKIQRSIKDVLRLNFITVILVELIFVLAMVNWNETNDNMIGKVVVIIGAIYFMSNPIVYATVMSDLRKCYTKIKHSCFARQNNRVNPHTRSSTRSNQPLQC